LGPLCASAEMSVTVAKLLQLPSKAQKFSLLQQPRYRVAPMGK
jgi:hypothetical protein